MNQLNRVLLLKVTRFDNGWVALRDNLDRARR